jgi:hypothetical protein
MPLKKSVCNKCYESKEVTWVWENDEIWLRKKLVVCPHAPSDTPGIQVLKAVKKDRFGKFHHHVMIEVMPASIDEVPAWCLHASEHD